jgi:hypothetical protein
MITDPPASPYGPPPPAAPVRAGIFGLGGRAIGRAALAGLVAEVGFVLLVAVVAVVARVLLGTCHSDSCIGGPAFYLSVLASPFAAFAALGVALVAFRVPRAWGVAGVAFGVALVLLVAAAAGVLGHLQAAGPVVAVTVGLLAAGFGPVSAVTATAMVNGRGALRFVPVPAVVVLVVLAVVLGQLRVPGQQASRITSVVPQPYAYAAPGATLYSLNLNGYTHALELGYSVGDQFVEVHESGPLPAAVRAAGCSPTLQVGEPKSLCRRLPAPDGVGIWRENDPPDPQLVGSRSSYVVVARPDATLVLFSATVTDDAAALALVAALRPTDARTLLDTATSVSVQ